MNIKGRHADGTPGGKALCLADFVGALDSGGVIRIDDKNHLDFWLEVSLGSEDLLELTLLSAHRYCGDHREMVEASEWCGCFHCSSLFRRPTIKEWVKEGQTALCPNCGIDAIIPDKSGFLFGPHDTAMMAIQFLTNMHKRWFEFVPKS